MEPQHETLLRGFVFYVYPQREPISTHTFQYLTLSSISLYRIALGAPDLKDRYEQLVNTFPKTVHTESGRGGAGTDLLGTKTSENIMVSRVGFEPMTLGLKERPSNSVPYSLMLNSDCKFTL